MPQIYIFDDNAVYKYDEGGIEELIDGKEEWRWRHIRYKNQSGDALTAKEIAKACEDSFGLSKRSILVLDASLEGNHLFWSEVVVELADKFSMENIRQSHVILYTNYDLCDVSSPLSEAFVQVYGHIPKIDAIDDVKDAAGIMKNQIKRTTRSETLIPCIYKLSGQNLARFFDELMS